MKKNIVLLVVFSLTIGIVLILIFNARYSFFTPNSDGWSIGFQRSDKPVNKISLSPQKILNYQSIDSITVSKTKFLADPFLLYDKGIYYLFFEHQAKGNANIGLLKSTDGKNYKYVAEVLDEPFHLSFPQVFKYKKKYYMLPETKQAGHVLLYKTDNFPFDWKISDTLIKNVKLKDPALLLSDSLNLISASDDDLTQHVYTADSLKGKWAISSNFTPRKGDETRAGGNFFFYESKWYIPFQNNKNGYGTGVSLYELNISNNEIYFKRKIKDYLTKSDSIKWFNRGMHHLNISKIGKSYYIVYDGDRESENGKNSMAWKASLKYNFYDFYNFIKN